MPNIEMPITIRKFEIETWNRHKTLHAVTEAHIRDAHGQPSTRPKSLDVAPHLYAAAMYSLDEDQKAYDAEVDAQRREESGRDV